MLVWGNLRFSKAFNIQNEFTVRSCSVIGLIDNQSSFIFECDRSLYRLACSLLRVSDCWSITTCLCCSEDIVGFFK